MIEFSDIDRIVGEIIAVLYRRGNDVKALDDWFKEQGLSDEALDGVINAIENLILVDYASGESAEVVIKASILMAFSVGWAAAKELPKP